MLTITRVKEALENKNIERVEVDTNELSLYFMDGSGVEITVNYAGDLVLTAHQPEKYDLSTI